VPSGLAESGKRERHFHKTKDDANAHATRLREKFQKHGEAATIIRPSLAEAAVTAERILRPWGVSLVEAARIVAEMRKQEQASKRLDRAAEAWLLACEGLRERTLGGYRQTADRLKESLGERVLASVSADELQEILAPPGSSGAAVLGRIRNAKAFWRWAAKKGWCALEVFDAVQAPKSARNQHEIGPSLRLKPATCSRWPSGITRKPLPHTPSTFSRAFVPRNSGDLMRVMSPKRASRFRRRSRRRGGVGTLIPAQA
jgi:hypothetical protein